MRKEERELRKLAKRYGLTLEHTASQHYRFRNSTLGVVAVTGSTPSNHRAQRNLEGQIRRAVGKERAA